MKKIVLYSAVSLDSFIARKGGSVDWLHDPDFQIKDEDFGYNEFYNSIDTILMGNNTYKGILGFDIPFPYADKSNYVFTNSDSEEDTEHVKFISKDAVEFIRRLKEDHGRDIWLVGGGQLNTLLINNCLVDRLILTVFPVVLGNGIPLFYEHDTQSKFKTNNVRTYDNGLIQTVYEKI